MSHSRHARRPRTITARLAFVIALALSAIPFLAGVAQAHHPEIVATIDCASTVQFTATAWAGPTNASRTNPDILVWYTVDNGPEIDVTHGAFNAANNYTFSGQFQAPTSGSIIVFAQAQANWANGRDPGSVRDTGPLVRPTNCGAPGLEITKTGPGTVAQGGTVTYTLTVKNTGSAATSTDVTVTDDLDNAYANVSATASAGTCNVGAGNAVSCNVGTLNAGKSATVTITATAPTGSCPTIHNVASASSGNLNDTSGTVVTDVTGCLPGLEITKSGPGTVTQGGSVTYSVKVTNTGTAATANDVTVSDDLADGYSNVAASASAGTCSVGGGNAVTCNVGKLGAGKSATVTITATAPTGSCPTITNVASASSGNLNDTSSTVTTDVTGCVPEVTFSKDGPATVASGGTVTYHISVHNGGSATSDPIVVTDTLDPHLSNVVATASQGTCTVSANAMSCALGTLAAGANATVTITAAAPTSSCPTIHNIAQVQQGNGNPQNTNEVDTSVQGCTPHVTVTKSASATSVVPGDRFTYTLVVANTGDAAATGVQLSDSIPAGLTIVDPLPSGCTATGNDITCDVGDIGAGGSVTRTFTVEAGTGACPDVDNVGTVTVGGGSSNSNVVNVDVLCEEGQIAVRIVKSNDADGDGTFTDSEEAKKEGSNVPFRLEITNTGDSAWTLESLTDTFAHVGLDLLDGPCDQLAGSVLQPGDSVTCVFTLHDYSPPAQTSLVNTAKVCVQMEGDASKTDCDKDDSTVRSAKVLGRTITPSPAPPPTRTPPSGVAFTGSDGRVAGLGLLAIALLLFGSATLYLGTLKRRRYDG